MPAAVRPDQGCASVCPQLSSTCPHPGMMALCPPLLQGQAGMDLPTSREAVRAFTPSWPLQLDPKWLIANELLGREKGQLTYWPTHSLSVSQLLPHGQCMEWWLSWEKWDSSALSEDKPVWGEDTFSTQETAPDWAVCVSLILTGWRWCRLTVWRAGSTGAFPRSPGAKREQRGRKKPPLVAANVTWKVLFLRRWWFIKLPIASLCWERMRMVALGALWEVKGPKRLSRSHCLPQEQESCHHHTPSQLFKKGLFAVRVQTLHLLQQLQG